MKTKIIRRILAAMVAAATFTSISGVASAVKRKKGTAKSNVQSTGNGERRIRRFRGIRGNRATVRSFAGDSKVEHFDKEDLKKLFDRAEKEENSREEVAESICEILCSKSGYLKRNLASYEWAAVVKTLNLCASSMSAAKSYVALSISQLQQCGILKSILDDEDLRVIILKTWEACLVYGDARLPILETIVSMYMNNQDLDLYIGKSYVLQLLARSLRGIDDESIDEYANSVVGIVSNIDVESLLEDDIENVLTILEKCYGHVPEKDILFVLNKID